MPLNDYSETKTPTPPLRIGVMVFGCPCGPAASAIRLRSFHGWAKAHRDLYQTPPRGASTLLRKVQLADSSWQRAADKCEERSRVGRKETKGVRQFECSRVRVYRKSEQRSAVRGFECSGGQNPAGSWQVEVSSRQLGRAFESSMGREFESSGEGRTQQAAGSKQGQGRSGVRGFGGSAVQRDGTQRVGSREQQTNRKSVRRFESSGVREFTGAGPGEQQAEHSTRGSRVYPRRALRRTR